MSKKQPPKEAAPETLPDLGSKGYHLPAGRYAERLKRERRGKKIAGIVAGVSLVGIALMSIIAFLGKVSGNFTIQVANQNVGATLSLSTDKEFTVPTTRLLAGGLSNAIAASSDVVIPTAKDYRASMEGGNSYALDATMVVEGEEKTVNQGLIYSFFVRNGESQDIGYDLTLRVDNYTPPYNGAAEPYSYFRVAFWADKYNVHDELLETRIEIYGEASSILRVKESDGIRSDENREFVGGSSKARDDLGEYRYLIPGQHEEETTRYCTNFLDGFKTIFYQNYSPSGDNSFNALHGGEYIHYTMLMWLEGSDPDCAGRTPLGASMAFSLVFGAKSI